MVLDQPINAVVRATAFFVRCERHDDIAVGLEALSPVTNQARDPNRSLRLVVAGAAPIKETIALNQLKRVHAPIFALGFHNIGVGEKQERLAAAREIQQLVSELPLPRRLEW